MKDNLSPQNLGDRLKAPTPTFWKKIRNTMIVVGTVGAALLSAGASLPPTIAALAPYLLTAGIVGSALPNLARKSPEDSVNEYHESLK